ncbi:hypothetical protein N7470_003891 [Penicillium chermesinum]|nr:hypothetical protein N7470_003891 [Penicillium chermesinum]
MVYCGKPSKGCGQCRSRKIRCDQVRPACSQCIRAKRECPGYRDQLALMFRDESSSVMKKAKADAKASSSASSSVASRPKRSPTRSPRTASPDWGSASEGAFSVGSKESFDFSAAPQPTNTVTQPSNQSIQRQWQMPMEVQPGGTHHAGGRLLLLAVQYHSWNFMDVGIHDIIPVIA